GSAVDLRHPNSKEFLKRDINNIIRFFKKRGMIVEESTGIFEDIVNEL
ncbi:MAG: serine protein kinase RIO, partial [Nitrosopumilus sp.]|nr:serine protein kinase RIO [Nitrosopumilus sp.]